MDTTTDAREQVMWTIIEVHSSEAVAVDGDPVLFDSWDAAAEWALANLERPSDYAIDEA